MGAYEVSLGDTIGTGTAGATQALIETVARRVPVDALAGHFHDTYGQALANVYAALQVGVATFDCSVAGPRRLPVRQGRHRQRRERGRALPARRPRHRDAASTWRACAPPATTISTFLGRPPASRVARALDARRTSADDADAA